MKLTVRTLKKYGACIEAVDWVKTQKNKSYKALFSECLAGEHLDWAKWIIARLLDKENKIRYAIYAATQVIHLYEDKYPGDDRPKKAIQAAKNYLKNPSDENAADAARAAHKDMLTKILKYGYRLLIKQEGGTP